VPPKELPERHVMRLPELLHDAAPAHPSGADASGRLRRQSTASLPICSPGSTWKLTSATPWSVSKAGRFLDWDVDRFGSSRSNAPT